MFDHALPILFRNHRPNPVAGSTDELMHEIAAAAGDPNLFAILRGRLLSTLRAATYNPTVHGHYGLRLGAYTHITSPLRRVADLINQRIVFAHLDHCPAPTPAISSPPSARTSTAAPVRPATRRRTASSMPTNATSPARPLGT